MYYRVSNGGTKKKTISVYIPFSGSAYCYVTEGSTKQIRAKETSSFSITSTDDFTILSYVLNGCTVSQSGNIYTFTRTNENTPTVSGSSYNYITGGSASVTLTVQLKISN